MHRLRFIYILIAILLIPFITSELPAQPTVYGNTAEILKHGVTMTNFRVYYDRRDDGGDTGWHTTFEGTQALDIASEDAGSVVGSFFSVADLPPGHISKAERTISGYFLIQAKVTYGGTTYYSKSDRGVSTNPADYAEARIPFIGEGGVPVESLTDESSVDITISADTRATIRLTFNLLSGTTGCVGLVNASEVPNPPPGVTYVICPRQPNVTQEIVYE